MQDEGSVIREILGQCEDPVILDLGAYGGEDTAWLIGACKVQPRVIAVEADPDNFARLQTANLPATLFHAAIADHNGDCTFYKCHTGRGVGSGSIRRPTGHVDRGGTHYDFRPITVRCLTLDYIFADARLSHIDLLWVDIQAAERDMIAGGQNALAHTRYLFIEAEQGEEMYEGQAMRDALLRMLPGWTLIGDFDFNILLRNDNL